MHVLDLERRVLEPERLREPLLEPAADRVAVRARGDEHVVAIQAQDGVLVLLQLKFADEVRSVDDIPVPSVKVNAREVELSGQLISQYAEGWTLDRMPAVDRNVLRIGVYELLWADDVPDAVAISEAVLLAQDLSTEASPAFVNGLLARIAKLKPSLQPCRRTSAYHYPGDGGSG